MLMQNQYKIFTKFKISYMCNSQQLSDCILREKQIWVQIGNFEYKTSSCTETSLPDYINRYICR